MTTPPVLPRGRTSIAAHLARDSWTALAVSTAARAVVATVLGLLFWSQAPTLLGFETTVVMSGSMSPAIQAGDIAIVRPTAPGTSSLRGQILLVDDPDRPGGLRLHRLVAVEESGLRLQGDANAAPDTSVVPLEAVHGVGVLRIPAVGLPVLWSAEQRWLLLTTAGGLLAVVLAAAGWHRASPAPAGGGGVRPVTGTSGRRPGRHAGPRQPPSRPAAQAAARLRRAGATTVLLVACSQLPGPAPVLAAYTASTVHAGDSVSTARVSTWGCIDETAFSASRFLALRETVGPTAYDNGTTGAAGNGTYRGGVTLGTAGPDCGHGGTLAVTLDGSTGWISTAASQVAPDDMTTQVWFRTTVAGGKLFGLDQFETTSGQYDRHVYMTDAGLLVFGVYRDGFRTISSPAGTSYADGAWHLVTATLGDSGMRLYVDGVEVAADPMQTVGEPFSGSWRFGYGPLVNWPSAPSNPYFSGSLASAAMWDRALTPGEVLDQHRPAA